MKLKHRYPKKIKIPFWKTHITTIIIKIINVLDHPVVETSPKARGSLLPMALLQMSEIY